VSLREPTRLSGPPSQPNAAADAARVREALHARLARELEREDVAALSRDSLAQRIATAVAALSAEGSLRLSRAERTQLAADLLDDVAGLGPLDALMRDPRVEDILVNGPDAVFVQRAGVLTRVPVAFRDAEHLLHVIDRIVSRVGRRVDEASPMVDARLPDGSRVNVILPPVSRWGPVLSIRRFAESPLGPTELMANGTFPPEIGGYLEAAVRTRLNILVSGGTGTGKTTLLGALSTWVSATERIVTVEDSAELRLLQPHVVSLEARPPNVEGRGEVTLTDLVKNSLRMRPDRIIVGEARGGEVMDMLQAMNTGHPGSMSTVHANSPRDALTRVEVMAAMGSQMLGERALRGLVGSAVDVIVQLGRLADGTRRIVSVSELHGAAGDVYALEPLFVFEQQEVSSSGRVRGAFRSVAAASGFDDHFRAHGSPLRPGSFGWTREVSE
jgi:pilus assembly protein CpaF